MSFVLDVCGRAEVHDSQSYKRKNDRGLGYWEPLARHQLCENVMNGKGIVLQNTWSASLECFIINIYAQKSNDDPATNRVYRLTGRGEPVR